MSQDKHKDLLPARVIKNALQRFRELTDMVIPPAISGSTNLARCTDAMRNFETSDHAGQTVSEMLDAYDGNERLGVKDQDSGEEPARDLVDPAKLKATLKRSAVEEYRMTKGLDKVRDGLIDALVRQISFEAGVNKIAALIDKAGLLRGHPLLALRRIDPKDMAPRDKVSFCFPDMTAEEAAWLSIAQIERTGLLYAAPAPFFYPVTMVDIDIDGLRFAFGTVNDERGTSVQARTVQQLVGVTGDDPEYKLVPFDHNVAQGIKAIVLLSINDDDLFRRIWVENDETPIRRGDAMLAKAMLRPLKPADVDWEQNLDHLRWKGVVTRADIDRARDMSREYAQTKLRILDSPVRTVLDLLRLVGMLQRVPAFILRQETFCGYAKLYGTNVEFISEAGVIVDSVPLHEHILLTTSYKFHDQIHDISKRNHVAEQLFGRLRQAVYHTIVDGEMQLSPDKRQSAIFDRYGIFTPVSATKTARECTTIEMLRAHLVENEITERTMKFSDMEFNIIETVLSEVPRDLLKNIRSITKEVSHAFTLKSLRSDIVQAGSYDVQRKQITISLPIETPSVENQRVTHFLEAIMGSPSQRRAILKSGAKLEEHKAYFIHALLHETGESIWAMMPQPIRESWAALTPDTGVITSMYLTSYARESASEDFCECFAIFFTHGKTFRRLAKTRPIIAAKYEFVKRLWCSDGKPREFRDYPGVTLARLHGKADEDPLKRLAEDDIEEAVLLDHWSRDEERANFADQVLSVEQLQEEMLEDEDEVNPYEKAARRRDRRDEQEQRDDKERKRRVIIMVNSKTEQALLALKIISLEVSSRFIECLHLGKADEARDILAKAGAKPKTKIAPTVDGLIRLYKHFEEDLYLTPEEKEDISEGLHITLSIIRNLPSSEGQDSDPPA